jgi:hypothetical protein
MIIAHQNGQGIERDAPVQCAADLGSAKRCQCDLALARYVSSIRHTKLAHVSRVFDLEIESMQRTDKCSHIEAVDRTKAPFHEGHHERFPLYISGLGLDPETLH